MLEHQLVLERCPKNVEEMHASIEFKFYQAITYFERYDERRLLPLLQQIARKSEIFLIRKLNTLNPLATCYIQALLFWIKHPLKTQELLAKWAMLESQDLFYRPYLEMGSCYQAIKDYAKAEECYNKCQERFKQNSAVFYFMGKLELERGNGEYAVSLLKRGLEINRHDVAILETLARYFEGQKRWKVAVEYYTELLDQQPNELLINKISQLVEMSHAASTRLSNSLKPKAKNNQEFERWPAALQKLEKQPIRKQPLEFRPSFQANIDSANIKPKEEQLLESKQIFELNVSSSKIKLKEEPPQSPPRRKEQSKARHEQIPKANAVDSLSVADKAAFNRMWQAIVNDPSNSDSYWAAIQFCQQRQLQEQCFSLLEQLIGNGKQQALLVNRVCKQIERLFLRVPSSHRRALHMLSMLKQFNKKSLFVYLYECYLCVLQEDRERAREASTALMLSLFVDQAMLRSEKRALFENYAFLMDKLIKCQNIDLLSLGDLYKRMVQLFEGGLSQQELGVSELLKEKIFLKNLLVSSKQSEITTIICVQGIPFDFLALYSHEIFIKEEVSFIVCDEASLKKHLGSCKTIIIFPQSLTLIGECIYSLRKRFQVFVIQMLESNPEDEAYIQEECRVLSRRNARISISPNLSLAHINQEIARPPH